MEQYLSQIQSMLEEIIKDSDFFLIEMKINRALRNQIDEIGWFPEGDYSLEISSPGVDAPLKFTRQYNKHIGRDLEITFNDSEVAPIIAKLISIEDEVLTLEETIGKKKEIKSHIIPLSAIKSAIVQISFK